MELCKFEFIAMTTPCELALQHIDERAATEAAKLIFHNTGRLERKYNFFSPESWLTEQVNERETGRVPLDAESRKILSEVRRLSEAVAGVFDITVGTVRQHQAINGGFRAAEFLRRAAALSRERVMHEYAGAMGYAAWDIEGDELIFNHTMTRLDLGGAVKEYAVDCAADIAIQTGCTGLISFGGDLRVIGKKISGEPFRVGIKNPLNPAESLMAIPLENAALTTSGVYERKDSTAGGGSACHIISSAMGNEGSAADRERTRADTLSATVIAETALASGILSTSLVLNPTLPLPDGVVACVLVDSDGRIQARQS